jgi:hypothetical protein
MQKDSGLCLQTIELAVELTEKSSRNCPGQIRNGYNPPRKRSARFDVGNSQPPRGDLLLPSTAPASSHFGSAGGFLGQGRAQYRPPGLRHVGETGNATTVFKRHAGLNPMPLRNSGCNRRNFIIRNAKFVSVFPEARPTADGLAKLARTRAGALLGSRHLRDRA